MPTSDKSSTTQRYRIRVVTPDGQSVTSEVVELAVRDALPSALVLRAEHGGHGLSAIDAEGDPDAVDPETLPLTPRTRERLADWVAAFEASVRDEDADGTPKSPGFASDEEASAFTAEGASLCEKLNLELLPASISVTYEPVETSIAGAPDLPRFLLKAERGCAPLWTLDEAGDPDALDLDRLPIPDDVKTRLHKWADAFDATAGNDDPTRVGFADQAAADAFEREARKLVAMLQRELGKRVVVSYEPVPVEVMPEEQPKSAVWLLKAERGCSPLWRLDESGDPDALDLELVAVSAATKERLHKWAAAFDATLNEDDPTASGFASADAVSSFELEANDLVAQLEKELGESVSVTYEAVEMPIASGASTVPHFVLKAEHGCSPIWTLDESGDLDALDLDIFPVSDASKTRLRKWAAALEATVNLDDPSASGFADDAAASAFREQGTELQGKLQRELGDGAQITYDATAELPIAASVPAQARFVLKAEHGCSPVWTLDEKGDLDALDLDLFPISAASKTRLRKWAAVLDATVNQDDLAASGFADEAAAASFRDEGTQLQAQLQSELAGAAEITYDATAELTIQNQES